jgi:hypothetical protein
MVVVVVVMKMQAYHSGIGMKLLWDGGTVGNDWNAIDVGNRFLVLLFQFWNGMVFEDGSLLVELETGAGERTSSEEKGSSPEGGCGGGSQTLRQHC